MRDGENIGKKNIQTERCSKKREIGGEGYVITLEEYNKSQMLIFAFDLNVSAAAVYYAFSGFSGDCYWCCV